MRVWTGKIVFGLAVALLGAACTYPMSQKWAQEPDQDAVLACHAYAVDSLGARTGGAFTRNTVNRRMDECLAARGIYPPRPRGRRSPR